MSTALSFTYLAFDGSWSVDLGTSAVRLGKIPGFTELALLGAVGSSSVIIDDPTGNAGHSGDDFLPYQRFRAADSRASITRIAELWTSGDTPVKYRRRNQGATDSLRTGVMREIELTLEDANTLAGRRPIAPKAVDSSVNRSAETGAARISWLLGTSYFSETVHDNGLVNPASITLPANDYSDSHPADVLNDHCTATGDNWFIYWDRTAAQWSLAVFNLTTYDGFRGSLLLSNDPTKIDSGLDGTWTAGPTNCWPVDAGEELERNWSQYANLVDYAWSKGVVERTATHTGYPVVGKTASSTSVTTSTLATTKADRYLSSAANPTDKITCQSRIGARNVNDALAGQLISAAFMEHPSYTSMTPFRVVRRTVAQVDESDEFYLVGFELVPASPATAVYSYAEIQYPQALSSASPVLLNWGNTGDSPRSPRTAHPLTGNMAYDNTGHDAGLPSDNTGIKMTGSGNIAIHCEASFEMGWNSGTHDVTLTVYNGSTVLGTAVKVDTGSGIHVVADYLTVPIASTAVVTNDIITAKLSWSGGSPPAYAVPFAGTDGNTYMSCSGYLV